MSLRSSSESSDRARSARCPVACCLPPVLVLVTAPGRCNSLILQRGTLVGLGCLAEGAQAVGNRRSGGSAEPAIWRCAEVSRSRTVARSASSCRFACSSLIRAWIASIRCLICSRRISRDCGSPPTLPACLLQAALPRMDKRQGGELGCLHGLLNSAQLTQSAAAAGAAGRAWSRLANRGMKRPRPITVKIRRTRLPSGMTSRSPPPSARARWCAATSALNPDEWTAPGILEALIPGRMQGHGGTAEVSR